MARILIVGGGCRGRALASACITAGHAVRVTTRTEGGRAAIERIAAECHVGTPARLATMRAALDGATIVCWLLAGASGSAQELAALHTTRLQYFMRQAVDTTVRGVVYETGEDGLVREGEAIVRAAAATHAIPLAVVAAGAGTDGGAERGGCGPWLEAAQAAIAGLLGA